MVSADPLAAAVRVLQRQGSRTLAEVCRDVHSLMPPSRAAQFRARCALATMLHCNALSDPAERAAAFYALRASYDAANPACFPFLPLFLQVRRPPRFVGMSAKCPRSLLSRKQASTLTALCSSRAVVCSPFYCIAARHHGRLCAGRG